MIEFSEKALDFLSDWDSFLDILEGKTGAGKTVVAIMKFALKVMDSDKHDHILSCLNTMKTEQNIINDPICGIVELMKDKNGNKLIEYMPNGKGNVKVPHLLAHSPKGDKVIYFISYSDKTKWVNVRAGRYGCIFIDECNLVPNDTPGQVPQFVTECLSRADDYVVMTLNPDDPDKEIYKIINQARPHPKYRKTGPKEIRNMLNLEPDPEYRWWFFDFWDNPIMTEEKVARIKRSCKTNKKDWNSRILGLRKKTEALAFPNFDDEIHVLSEETIRKQFKIHTENGKQVMPTKKFKAFYAGVDTSYSNKTDDLIAFMFAGVTTTGEVYVLDEFAHNNRDYDLDGQISASDIPLKLQEFLSKNSKKWGYCSTVYVDEADSNLLLELRKHPIYPFHVKKSSKSKFKIPDRMRLYNDLINHNQYFVCESCTTHIHEMNVMSLDPKDSSRPEDKNNHTYDALSYGLTVPYLKGYIGQIFKKKGVITDEID